MDRADARRRFLCGGAAVFLSARAPGVRRGGGGMGDLFLRVRAAQHRREPRVHAGYSVAQPGADWDVFFPGLGRAERSAVADGVGSFDFTGAADQIADGGNWSAVALSGSFSEGHASACPGRAEARPSGKFARALGALAVRADHAGSVCYLVLARASDGEKFLSVSFLR